jgi:prevent-host-death family protein
MDEKTRQALINELSNVSTMTDAPLTIKHKGKPVVVVVPAADYQKLEAVRMERLKCLKSELNGILTLVRTHTQQQSLEEVEARLAALRKKIEQEMEEY